MLDFTNNREKRRRKRKHITFLVLGFFISAGVIIGGIYLYKIKQLTQTTETQIEASTEDITETGNNQEAITTGQQIETESVSENITEPETESTTAVESTTSPYDIIPPSADYFVIAPDADRFFENSVFVGDSVMMGFRNYCMKQEPEFLGTPTFLVSGSYSLRMALSPVSKDSIHPVYQGEQRRIWDSIAMTGARKVFLFFGLNDLGMESVELATQNYIELMKNIKEVNPDVEIFIISTTYMNAESQLEDLNNTNIRSLNENVKKYCDTTKEAAFINVADFLIGEDGGLKKEYCSDDYVHQTNAAYEVWTKVLRGYAGGWEIKSSEEMMETLETSEEITETAETSKEITD